MRKLLAGWLRRAADALHREEASDDRPGLPTQRVLGPPVVRDVPPGPEQIGHFGSYGGPDYGAGLLGSYPWAGGGGAYL